MGKESRTFKERYPIGQTVAYWICQEMPERAYKWRAYNVRMETDAINSIPAAVVPSAAASVQLESEERVEEKESVEEVDLLLGFNDETEVKEVKDYRRLLHRALRNTEP